MKGKVTYTLAAKAFVIISLMLISATSQAQVSMHLGLTGGAQMSNLTSDIGNYNSKMGINVGIFDELRFGNYLSTRLEVLSTNLGAGRAYDQKLQLPNSTAANSFTTITYKYNTTESLSYQQFNLLIQGNLPIKRKRIIPYDLNKEGGFYFSAFAGAYYALLSGHVRTGTIEYIETGPAPYEDTALVTTLQAGTPERPTQGVFPADLGVIAGLGMNYSFGGKITLSLNGRYQMGFNSVDDGSFGKEEVDYTTDKNDPQIVYKYANIVNSAMGVNLGLSFKIF